jgi:hypothetical protein
MFIKATMPSDKKNQNSELFFRQTHEIFGCLQLWVLNPISLMDCLQLLSVIQCLEWVIVNEPLSIHILENDADSETQGSGQQKWKFEPIFTSLSAFLLPLMSHQ